MTSFAATSLKCSKCFIDSPDARKAWLHYLNYHKDDEFLELGCYFCGRPFKTYQSFRNHVYKNHATSAAFDPGCAKALREFSPESPVESNVGDVDKPDEEMDLDIQDDSNSQLKFNPPTAPVNNLEHDALMFVSSLIEDHHLPHSSVPFVIDGIKTTAKSLLDELILRQTEMNEPANLNTLSQNLEQVVKDYPLNNLNSYRRIKTRLLEYGLVLPIAVVVSKGFKPLQDQGIPSIVEKDSIAYVVPFKESLEQILSNEDIWNAVFNSHVKSVNPNRFVSVKDGLVYKNHPICKKFRHTILILLYIDDIEVVNPLGANTKKHKLTQFYWLPLNIPEYLRSSLKAIFLLASVKASIIKDHGYSAVLDNFFSVLEKLESDEGLDLNINGEIVNLHGTLLCFCGDTLASNEVGGFKGGVGFAHKMCRNCDATRPEFVSIFHERELRLRNQTEHDKQVLEVTNPHLLNAERLKLSRNYGVNADHIFRRARDFNVIKQLPQDAMHAIPEGVLSVELKALLYQLIEVEKLLTFEELNNLIKCFEYPVEFRGSKPSMIERQHVLDGKLRQSASQMLCLGVVIPFLLAPFVTVRNDYFMNFVLLSKIVNVIFGYEIEQDTVHFLRVLIDVHHSRFVTLYDHINPTPKFHFMVHIPSVIENFGPIRNTWCMRFEGKHLWFGKVAVRGNNFKNLPKMVSHKHQVKLCADLRVMKSSKTFLTRNVLSLKDEIEVDLDNFKFGSFVKRALNLEAAATIWVGKLLCVNNFQYRKNSVVMLTNSEDSLPGFASVVNTCRWDQVPFLTLRLFKTVGYDELRNSYVVQNTNFYHCKKIEDLLVKQTFPKFFVGTKAHVVLTNFADRIEFMG